MQIHTHALWRTQRSQHFSTYNKRHSICSQMGFTLVRVDDIVIFSRSPMKINPYVLKVITVLNNAELTLEFRKYCFCSDIVMYHKHVICPRCPEVVSHTTGTICGLKIATNWTELRSVLGLYKLFGNFVARFTSLAVPLNKNLEYDQPSTFTTLHELRLKSTRMPKDALILPHGLPLPE